MDDTRPRLDEPTAGRLAAVALAGIEREFPNKLVLAFDDASDVRSPRAHHPAFYGCFDWHSAVHSHWCLARLARAFPEASWAGEVGEALGRRLTAAHLAGELATIDKPTRAGFERPYGLAWLLTLAAELRQWGEAAAAWREALGPLEQLARDRLASWLPRLPAPIRDGQHGQTAFAIGLALDASGPEQARFASGLRESAFRFHGAEPPAAWHREPSGHDFLSPGLGEADLMRRVLGPAAFAGWLDGFWPSLGEGEGRDARLEPVSCPDRDDGKLAHLDGLNLSRAWMLEGVAAGLPEDDPRRAALQAMADAHGEAGLAPALAAAFYAGSHWLGSFAVYYLTRTGLGGA